MLTPIEVKVLERNAEYLGVPVEELMENAGSALADAVLDNGGKGKNILIFSGPGNNGGDGFAAAAKLQHKAKVKVVLVKPPTQIKTVLARRRYEDVPSLCKVLGGADEIVADISWADIIVDAMLGVGIKGVLREPYITVVHLINSSEKTVISADVPTGLGEKEAVVPDVTVTFHGMKEGMTKKNSGNILIADIGIPEEASTYTGPGLFHYYPANPNTSHKGDNGRLLVVGGGPYTGAPALAAMAAYRTGADLVEVAAPCRAADIIAGYSPNLVVHPCDCEYMGIEQVDEVVKIAKKSTAILLGPGIGSENGTKDFLLEIFSKIEVPVVVDADALTLLSGSTKVLRQTQTIVTPHRQEFSSLFKNIFPDQRKGKLEEKLVKGAKEIDGVVLLKGQIDMMADGQGNIRRNRTGNSAMTVGGTGDVLAGVITALAAKGVSMFDAASLGAFITGCAGDAAFHKKSYGLTATDVIEEIPSVLRTFI